ncbi:MAG TPA: 50S ribosomal protein L18 [Verrucomicrobiae bacterium]|jgi:large subunit ribosomal protein L18|nr:50S ribosomal protein L18 [Verrucomicrobiae bacterium]
MKSKNHRREKRHGKIRKRLSGTPERPRLCVHRSLKNIYVQVVDDIAAKTLCSFSTLDKDYAKVKPAKGKVPASTKLGEYFAGRLKERGITKVAFDRGGYLYHGRVKALADALRQGGIEF